jgi:hypothetical protein
MASINTSAKGILAFLVLGLSTLSSYAKIIRIVFRERLWRLPVRELRRAAPLANASRRIP